MGKLDCGRITLAAAKALSKSIQPVHGGEIVEEVVLLASKNEPAAEFRWSAGFVVERCFDGCYVWLLGESPDAAMKIDLDFIARAGDEWPDAVEIDCQRQLDEDARLNPAELDRLFDLEFSEVLPRIPANMNGVG